MVGDRPEDLEGALGHMRDRGPRPDRHLGGLGPTADDLTAEVVGRFAGRELVLDDRDGGEDHRIIARYRAAAPVRPRGGARGQPQAGDGPGGRDGARSGGDRARPRRARRRPGRDRAPGPAARAPGDVAAGAGGAAGRGGARRAPSPTGRCRSGCSASRSRSSPRRCARSRTTESPLDELEVTTCLRGGELVTDVRHRPGAEDAAEGLRAGWRSASAASRTPRAASPSRRSSSGCSAIARSPWPSPRAAACSPARLTLRPGSSKWFAGGVVSYSNDAKIEAAGRRRRS